MSKYSVGGLLHHARGLDARPPAPTCRPRSTAGPCPRRRGYADGLGSHRDLHRSPTAATAPAPASSSVGWTTTGAASSPAATTGTPASSTCSGRGRAGRAARCTCGRSASATGSPPAGAQMDELFPPEPAGAARPLRARPRSAGTAHLLEVTINRPEARNSLHPPRTRSSTTSSTPTSPTATSGSAILTGAGDKAFSARQRPGLLRLRQARVGPQERLRRPDQPSAACTSRSSPPSTGTRWAAAARSRSPATSSSPTATAQFALSEVRVGLVASAGGLVRLPRTIPPKVATEMILTGRRITAAEALGYGLVNRVVPAGLSRWRARARSPRRSSTAHPRRCGSRCSSWRKPAAFPTPSTPSPSRPPPSTTSWPATMPSKAWPPSRRNAAHSGATSETAPLRYTLTYVVATLRQRGASARRPRERMGPSGTACLMPAEPGPVLIPVPGRRVRGSRPAAG